jgi:hypothetical protein
VRDPNDPWVRISLYADGSIVDETWICVSDTDYEDQFEAVHERQGALAEMANAIGSVWCAEFYDPGMGMSTWIGTDADTIRAAGGR